MSDKSERTCADRLPEHLASRLAHIDQLGQLAGVYDHAGDTRVQVVALDDPSPGYAEQYANLVAGHLAPGQQLRWCEVDVSRVSEYGPNDVAAMLLGDVDLVTDLPQEWEVITRG